MVANRSSSDGCDASTASSSILVMMSPTRRPAAAAEPPSTRVTRTPVRPVRPSFSASCGVSTWTDTGTQALRVSSPGSSRPARPTSTTVSMPLPAAIERRPASAIGSDFALRQLLDPRRQRRDVLHPLAVDFDDHVVVLERRPSFRRRTARADAAHVDAVAALALELLGRPRREVRRGDPDERQLADRRFDALALLGHDVQRLLAHPSARRRRRPACRARAASRPG